MALKNKNILITGGCGFIGTNAAAELSVKNKVIIIDDLSRRGTEYNLKYLKKNFDIEFYRIDISDKKKVLDFFNKKSNIDAVIHLAGQVAVTTSIINPYLDFSSNLSGTINILEGVRRSGNKPIIIFSSTNKVYGALEHYRLKETSCKYSFSTIKFNGVNELEPVDFYSPYGCSKGGADQYVHDYFRIFDIPTVVFRQSCIYGKRQFGVEDQGWLAWFLFSMMKKRPITIFGNGKQVRDVLYISDLINAYILAIEKINDTAGNIYNIGGGKKNALSIIEYLEYVSGRYGIPMDIRKKDWRPGDQLIYISDTDKFRKTTGWKPTIDIKRGIGLLYDWLLSNYETISKFV